MQELIKLNNRIIDFIIEKDDYKSSHPFFSTFYDDILDTLYTIQQGLLFVFVESQLDGTLIFKIKRLDAKNDINKINDAIILLNELENELIKKYK